MTPRRPRLPRVDFNDALPFKIDGEPCKLIQLTLGYWAIVEADLYPWLSRYKWHARLPSPGGPVYAARNGSHLTEEKHIIQMHREIMKAKDGEEVDHRFHNTLDNRKSQMRCCLKLFNTHNVTRHRDNRSGYKGVYFHPQARAYYARIMVRGIVHTRGPIMDPIVAARAYDSMATQFHGEFAKTNFPQEVSK